MVRMVRVLLLLGWSVWGASAWAQEDKKSLEAFSELDVKGSVNVKIDFAQGAAAGIQASSDLLKLVNAAVSGGMLVLDTEGNLPAEKDVQLSTSELKLIRVTSSADVEVRNYKGEHLAIEIFGSGDVYVQGEANGLKVRIVGSGDVNATDLKVKSAEVNVLGSGDVHVAASDELTIQLMGSGDVHYSGSPKLTQNLLGSGDVIQD